MWESSAPARVHPLMQASGSSLACLETRKEAGVRTLRRCLRQPKGGLMATSLIPRAIYTLS